MPFIPYVRPQGQAAVPAPVTGNPATPRADLRGVMGAAGSLAKSAQQPEIPTEPFLAPGRGMQAAGDGIQQVGGLMEKLANYKAEAQNDMDAADAENALSMKFAKFSEEMQSRPATEWESEWEPRAMQATEEILQSDKLSPVARQRIDLMGKKWRGDTAVRVATMATQAVSQRAADSWNTSIQRAADEGDFGKARSIIEAGKPKGYTSDSDIYQAENLVKEAEQKAAWQQEGALILENPDTYLAENSAIKEGESPAEYSRRIEFAQSASRDVTHAGVADVANEIATNPNATEATLEAKAAGRLEPAELEKWNAELSRRRNLKVQFERAKPSNIDAAFARLLDEAELFDRTKPGAKAEYARLHREAEGHLPIGLRGEVTGIIEKKWRASSDLPDPPEPLKQSINETARSMFEAGTLGQFKELETKVVDGKTVEKEVTNPKKEQAALAKKGALLIYMQKWTAANPQKTPAEAQAVMRDFNRGAAPVIRYTKPPAEAPQQSEANGAENDLPRSADGSPLTNELLPPMPDGLSIKY